MFDRVVTSKTYSSAFLIVAFTAGLYGVLYTVGLNGGFYEMSSLEHLRKVASYIQVQSELARMTVVHGSTSQLVCHRVMDIREKAISLSTDSFGFEGVAEKAASMEKLALALSEFCGGGSGLSLKLNSQLSQMRDLARDYVFSVEHFVPPGITFEARNRTYPMPIPDAPAYSVSWK